MNEATERALGTREQTEKEELKARLRAGLVSVVEDYEATAAEKLEASRLLLQILEG